MPAKSVDGKAAIRWCMLSGRAAIRPAGFDLADYTSHGVSIIFDMATGSISDGVAVDSLIGIEAVTGSSHDDSVLVTAQPVLLLDGGAGQDQLSATGALAGVVLDLSDANIISFESLIGSAHDDVLIGDAQANYLHGGMGDDQLIGGAGADIFSFASDSGTDTLTDFSQSDGDVIDLQAIATVQDMADLVITAIDADADGTADDTLVDTGSAMIRLLNIDSTALTASDFLFA